MRCPKCNATIIYNMNSPMDRRNICAECGLSHEPGNNHQSFYKQLGMWEPPKEEES